MHAGFRSRALMATVTDEEEELQRLEKEVEEMAGRVKEMRRQGPARFRGLLDDYLRKLRPPVSGIEQATAAATAVDASGNAKDETTLGSLSDEIASLQMKLSSAMDSLPTLLERINKCTSELDRKLVKLKDNKSYHLVFEEPRSEDLSFLTSKDLQLLADK